MQSVSPLHTKHCQPASHHTPDLFSAWLITVDWCCYIVGQMESEGWRVPIWSSDHLHNEIPDHLELKSPCLYLVIMIIEKIFSLGIEKFIIFHHYPSNFRSGLDLTWARSPPYRRSESGETLNEYSLWRLGPGCSVVSAFLSCQPLISYFPLYCLCCVGQILGWSISLCCSDARPGLGVMLCCVVLVY